MMNTCRWNVSQDDHNNNVKISDAASMIQHDEVVAFPTETVYGLGGNAYSDDAIKKIFKAKGRPSDNPLIVHVCSYEMMNEMIGGEVPMVARKLTQTFWPGPLTVIVNTEGALKRVSPYCTSDLTTVGVRMPDHPIALELIRKCGVPIAAPSANTSGRPSPTTADHVMADLNGKICGVLDGGPTFVGVESTVVDCTLGDDTVVVLRPGGVSAEEIATIVPNVVSQESHKETSHVAPRAPGMKYTHYAPQAPLHIVMGDMKQFAEKAEEFEASGEIVGVMCTKERLLLAPELKCKGPVCVVGDDADLASVARQLYHSLRSFDDTPTTVILCVAFPYEGIGCAIMNRLVKAASSSISS